MADVLRLVAGELDQQTDPADWITLSAGEIVTSAVSSEALSLVAGERDMVAAPAGATVDSCCSCSEDCGTTNAGCGTCSSCSNTGHAGATAWTHTGCVDASMHISLWRKIGAGSWLQWIDPLGCNNDNYTCDPFTSCKVCSIIPSGYDGIYEWYHNDSGGAGETWDFRVYIHNDSDHSVVDGPCESVSTTVSTTICVA
jgi:hypothetical protein